MKKITEKKKIFMVLISALILTLQAIINSENGKLKYKRFFNSEIHSTVTSSSIDWELRYRSFHLKDNSLLKIYLSDTDKIKIGDSISKPSKTFFYEVYRKKNTNNEYELYKINDGEY